MRTHRPGGAGWLGPGPGQNLPVSLTAERCQRGKKTEGECLIHLREQIACKYFRHVVYIEPTDVLNATSFLIVAPKEVLKYSLFARSPVQVSFCSQRGIKELLIGAYLANLSFKRVGSWEVLAPLLLKSGGFVYLFILCCCCRQR